MAYIKQKRIMSVPPWYSDHIKESEERQLKELELRKNESHESLDELKKFFTSIKSDDKRKKISQKKLMGGGNNMPKIDPNTGQQYYTLKEQQDYHYNAAKKGSKAVFNGQEYVRSDFARGQHKAIADNIAHRRHKYKQRIEAQQAAANVK